MDRLGEMPAAWVLAPRVGNSVPQRVGNTVSSTFVFTPKATPDPTISAKQYHNERM